MNKKRSFKYNGGAGAADFALTAYGNMDNQRPISEFNNHIAINRPMLGGKSKRGGTGMMVPFNLMLKTYSKKVSHRKTNKLYKKLRQSRKNKTRR